MWEITKPVIERVVLDFSSSGQPETRVSRLMQDGQVIFNAIELIDWTPSPFQAIVCETCGTPGCASGGWLNLRSTGELILLLPVFGEMSEPRHSRVEYAPPSYFLDEGVPYLTRLAYDRLQITLPQLPPLRDIPSLRTGEGVSLFQIEAPYQLFGVPPNDFVYSRDLVVGVSNGDVRERLNQIQALALDYINTDTQAILRPQRDDEEILSLYVDSFDFIDWPALACADATCRLIIASRFVLNAEEPAN